MDHPRLAGFEPAVARETKFFTSSPFTPELKTEVLRKLPGRLLEYYGLTRAAACVFLRRTPFPTNCIPSASLRKATTCGS